MKQVAVFLPSEIYVMCPFKPGALPRCALYQGSDGEYKYKYYSTGRLEAAIKADYEVYVMNATPEGKPYAEWWLKLVPADHILSIGNFVDMKSILVQDAFRELYRKLSLPWDNNIELWPSLLNALPGYGIKRGCYIEPLAA